MTTLPATDLGIMAEHLMAHEGVINKLVVYQVNVTNPVLKEIIVLQTEIMRAHVKVMLALINPQDSGYIEVPPLSDFARVDSQQDLEEQETDANTKWITLEAHTTAKCMAVDNFFSALMMKDKNVRNAHTEMALQQQAVQEKYASFIKEMGWGFVPHASVQEQVSTFQHFQNMF